MAPCWNCQRHAVIKMWAIIDCCVGEETVGDGSLLTDFDWDHIPETGVVNFWLEGHRVNGDVPQKFYALTAC